jgi:NADPH:quinone reductase-like Zn-dependent oxidoreductase
MRALQLQEFGGPGSVRLVEKAVPKPRRHEVLVRVCTSPVNQSDILFCEGRYSAPSRLPITPGFEGCGVVVQAGSWRGRWLVGHRVACGNQAGDGLWAEYAVVPLWNCLPLPRRVDDEQGACAIVNPVTAWALFEPLRTHRAMVQTAAASQLGRMILRLSQRYRRPVVHVVHRPGLVDLLRKLGAEHVLDSSTPDFAARLRAAIAALKPTYAIDAVGGPLAGQLLEALPRDSTLVLYGALSGQSFEVSPGHTLFMHKRLEGFHLASWLQARNPASRLLEMFRVRRRLGRELRTEIAVRTSLADAPAVLATQLGNHSKGKILICPAAAPARRDAG